ncbi:MAG: hypothetical protein IPM82_02755 [Saprospiraceae bacterium]|nr:hypothetical protein [Saprospiraceae bacterium]
MLSTDNVKHNLQAAASASNEIKINTGSFAVQEDGTTNVVLDFDLRKLSATRMPRKLATSTTS